MNTLGGSAEGWGQIQGVKPEPAQTLVGEVIVSLDTGGCPEHHSAPLVLQGAPPLYPYSGEAQEMLQLFQHYPCCEQHLC